MDSVWFGILAFIDRVSDLLDVVFGTLHEMGPAVTIVFVALLAVLIQKLLGRFYKPKRLDVLRRKYYKLRELRDEAMKWEDREKAKRLARNIDQAELNQAYYNYFFEGLMVSLLTRYLPFFALLAYVNSSYRGEYLLDLFDRNYVFAIGKTHFGGVIWYTFCVLLIHVIWFFVARRLKGPAGEEDAPQSKYG